MPTTQKPPWSNARELLWAAGVFGLLLFGFVLVVDLFLGGIDLDGRKPPIEKNALGWICDLANAMVLIYYICTAHLAWSRIWWRTGIVLHVVSLLLIFLVLSTGGRTIGNPLFMLGAVPWLFYAKQNKMIRDVA